MKYSYIKVQTNSKEMPSTFIGTTLRGTFGHILKEQVCTQSHYNCEECIYQEDCLLYLFYPTLDDKYRSYRIDARMDAKTYDFGIYLFGDFSGKIRQIIQALYRMLHSHRVISNDKRLSFPKSKIFYNATELSFDSYGLLLPFKANAQTIAIGEKEHYDITLHLLTPLYIKTKKGYKKNLSLEDILLSIYKRKYFFEHQKMVHSYKKSIRYRSVSAILHERDPQLGERYSLRQKRTIPIEGMLGEIEIKGLDKESYMLLKWGEILGVGKGTALGAGAIKIE